MSKLIQEGPRNAKIVIVGECPTAVDSRVGKPFQGGSGDILDRVLERSGLRRSDCFLTNLVHDCAPGNDFKYFTSKARQADLLRGLLQLREDISSIRPNLVIALGASPLQYITGKAGIEKWRGSILESRLVPGQKVIATYHPAYVLRVWESKAVVEFDLARAATESLSPLITRPERSFYLHHTHYHRATDGTETRRQIEPGEIAQVVREMEQAEWLAEDIECWQDDSGKWKLACVGWSDHAGRALVVHNDGPSSMEIIRRLSACPAKKIFQNGLFDYTVLTESGIEVTNFAWDTMLGHHSLFTESASGSDEISSLTGKKRSAVIQKGLAFQTSLYTREPFYKDDGKLWRATNDLVTFWKYNALDCVITREIRDVQAKELTDFGTWDTFNHEMSLIPVIYDATTKGIRIDLNLRASFKKQIEIEIERLQNVLDSMAGSAINTKSTKQVMSLIYDKLQLPIKTNRKTKNPTADKHAIVELAAKHNHPTLLTILKIRERRDLIERYLDAAVDSDGRMRCSFDITGTRSGRLSSRASLHGSGTNLQNIPARKKEGEIIRRMFTADANKCFVYRDFSQAEARVVAYLASCQGLIELFEDPNRDLHRENGSRIFGKPVGTITDEERYLAKRVIHACNYGMAADLLVQVVNEDSETTGIRIDRRTASNLIERYFLIYPEIREIFWANIKRELRYSRTLVSHLGRRRTFYGRMDDKLEREAISYIPQSDIGDLGAKAWRLSWELGHERPEIGLDALVNVHDSVLNQCNLDAVPFVTGELEKRFTIPFDVGGYNCVIPTDCKIGLNWGKRGKDNPDGLVDYDKGGAEWLKDKFGIG